jgi:hypothetical protein
MQTKHATPVVSTRRDPVPAPGGASNDGGVLLGARSTARNGHPVAEARSELVAPTDRNGRYFLPDADPDPVPPRRCRWNADYV